jgi:hypothetical protein
MRLALLILGLVTALAPSCTYAQDTGAPVYMRSRGGDRGWHGGGGFGYGGLPGYGYLQPYYPPVVASSWYARPYPYHFDYFNGRWGGEDAAATSAPISDCPCASEVAPSAVP